MIPVVIKIFMIMIIMTINCYHDYFTDADYLAGLSP